MAPSELLENHQIHPKYKAEKQTKFGQVGLDQTDGKSLPYKSSNKRVPILGFQDAHDIRSLPTK